MHSTLDITLCCVFIVLGEIFNFNSPTFALHTHDTGVKDVGDLTNAFSGCTNRMINFCGLTINFNYFKQLVVLMRYFSFPSDYLIFPFELSPKNNEQLTEAILSTDMDRLETTRTLQLNNVTLFLPEEIASNYMDIMAIGMALTTRNTNCQANINLHPPNQKNGKLLYFRHHFLKIIIKDPFWVQLLYKKSERWRRDFINTTPKYSLLISDTEED